MHYAKETQLRAKKLKRHNSVTAESSETQLRAKSTQRHNSVRFGAKRHNSVISSKKRHNSVILSILETLTMLWIVDCGL